MATITHQRAALAAALSGVSGLRVRDARPAVPRAGDGWVSVQRVSPGATVRTCDCTFVAVLLLGADERSAADQAAILAVPIIDAVTTGPLHPDGVAVETATITSGDGGDLYSLIVTLTVEVD